MKTTYEVWVLGYDELGNVNDYDEIIKTFDSPADAIKFAEELEIKCPNETPQAQLVVEKVIHYKYVSECVERLYEREI